MISDMRTGAIIVLLCAALSSAQEATPKPKPKSDEHRDAKTKVQEMLEGAIDMVPTASPSVQVAALMDAAVLYADSKRAKTIELLEQAFRAAAAVPPT